MNNKSTFIITEIAQAHDGSLGILHSYIDAIANTGVDAIKFQTHIAEAESSTYEPFRKNFSYVDNTRFDYWKRMEFTKEQWLEIKKHCDSVDIEFMSSPFSIKAVNWLEEIGMKRYKIASGEISNFLMLDKIAKIGKDIILSTGMSSFSEIDKTISFLKNYNNKLSILQCTTQYPTDAQNIGLNVMLELKEKYEIPVGLSDHSGEIFPSLAAVSKGAEIVEFHAVFDKEMFGPDSKSSLTINQIKTVVKGIRYIDEMHNHSIDKNDIEKYKSLKEIFGKALAVNRDMKKGEIIQLSDLESKKPSFKGIHAKDFKKVIGKKLLTDKNKYDFITLQDIEFE